MTSSLRDDLERALSDPAAIARAMSDEELDRLVREILKREGYENAFEMSNEEIRRAIGELCPDIKKGYQSLPGVIINTSLRGEK